MPGLIGVIGDLDSSKTATLLAQMALALKHEDWYRVDAHADNGFGLGRVSLGISNPEPQPIWSEDENLCLVMEGEIYDYGEWKKRLIDRGHRFLVDNDAEFVLHLFEELGDEFASKLNGAFVAAIWDRRRRRLVLANDRLGLYPLYYSQHSDVFEFGSGVRALLADPTLPRHVDPVAIAETFTFDYILGTRTLLTDVHLLPPASILTFCGGQLILRSYWEPSFPESHRPISEEAYLEELVHHLGLAVSRQSQDTLPKGVLLSGGLDSRMIAALLSDCLTGKPLHTFTFGIPNCDDARLAREVAGVLGTEHSFSELKPDYLLTMAEEGVRLTDGMSNCVHMHVLANLRAQAKYAKVIYKGFMGDTLMGYAISRLWVASYDHDALSRIFFHDPEYCQVCQPAELEQLFSKEFRDRIERSPLDGFRAALAEARGGTAADKQTYCDIHQRQRRFTLAGVELARSQAVVRTPYCDNDLVDFALTVPPGLRLDRFLMIRAVARLFPELAKVPLESTGLPLVPCARDVRVRMDRQLRWRLRATGLKWVSPPLPRPYHDYDTWMRTSVRSWVEGMLLSKRTLGRGYFNPNYVHELVTEHMSGANNAPKLGRMLALEIWHRQFLD